MAEKPPSKLGKLLGSAREPAPRRPGLFRPPGHWLTSEQVHNSLGETLLADNDVQLARTGDPFKNFQFAQTHQGRVAFEQLGGVSPPTHGPGSLPPPNHVLLPPLLAFRH